MAAGCREIHDRPGLGVAEPMVAIREGFFTFLEMKKL
jgi:hypothetical protein